MSNSILIENKLTLANLPKDGFDIKKPALLPVYYY